MRRSRLIVGLLTCGLLVATPTLVPPAAAQPSPPVPLVTQVADINPNGDSEPLTPVVVDGILYFAAYDPTHGRQIWAYDAAVSEGDGSTYRVTDLPAPGIRSLYGDALTVLDGQIYFPADTPATGVELFGYDPATGQTRLVVDLEPGPAPSYPRRLTPAGGKLYFYDEGPNYRLWEYDPAGNTVRLVLQAGPHGYVLPRGGVGDTLYLVAGAIAGVRGPEMFAYDTTTIRHLEVVTNFPGTSGYVGAGFWVVYGLVYFTAYTADRGFELYTYDAATGRIGLVPEVQPGPASSYPDYVVGLGGRIYFTATGTDVGNELWRFDPVSRTVTLAADIEPANTRNHTSSSPHDLTVIDGRLYFSASRTELPNAPENRELWVYDPQSDGGTGAASMVDDLYAAPSGNQSGMPTFFADATVGYDGAVLFAARAGTRGDSDGYEVYRYDPRPTELAAVLYAESEVSAPGTVQVTAYLRNNTASAVTGRLRLEVVSPDGAMTVQPLPNAITVPGRDVATVQIPVLIPAGSPAGSYSGTLTLAGQGQRLGADTFQFSVY